MIINLLTPGYENDLSFYHDFIDTDISLEKYTSEEYRIVDEDPDFPIYFNIYDNELKKQEFKKLLNVMKEKFIQMDREIYLDGRFWHSYLCLYKREFLLEQYPQILDSYDSFRNIVIKDFDWENYIYKAALIAQYVYDQVPEEEHDHFFDLIIDNMDMFNYIIKYEIFRNAEFLINIMRIIEETGTSKILKAKIKGRTDLGRDERYGRRVIYEMNKSYPVVLSPMLNKDELKKYFWKFLGYYYPVDQIQNGVDEVGADGDEFELDE